MAATIAVFGCVALAANLVQRANAEARMQRDLAAIIELIGDSEALSFHQRVDGVRRFVNLNSEHNIDGEFWAYHDDTPQVVRRLLEQVRGTGQRPHLECASRSRIMSEILARLDIRSRSVSLYQPLENFPSHTFLEVYNPTSRAWEIQDPDYDLFYVDAASRERLSTEMLLTRPLDSLQPCTAPQRCGWTVTSREGQAAQVLTDYFKAAAIKDGNTRSLLVNTERFDLDEPRPVRGEMQTFCEHEPKLCSGSIVRLGGG